ncbi:hypothetical protein [Bradyrhizobium sp. HKCCYLR1022]|uniref:hypothetical protein n=1 Tax=Bradyrhizobium TaxID=374 RepID=UPI003EB8AD5A
MTTVDRIALGVLALVAVCAAARPFIGHVANVLAFTVILGGGVGIFSDRYTDVSGPGDQDRS